MIRPRQPRRRTFSFAAALALATALCGSRDVGGTQAFSPASPAPFRVAFSSSMFTDVNESDARASVKAWATSFARERGIEVAPDAQVIPDAESLTRALADRSIDAAGMTAADFFRSGGPTRWSPIFGATVGDSVPDRYCLLVHRDRGVRNTADLAQGVILIYANPRNSLADCWLDHLLRREGLPTADRFFRRVTAVPKLSQVILPVFFHQADACIVTRRGFETLVELNPQVGRELTIVTISSPVVATVFCLRADFDSPSRAKVIDGLEGLHRSASGRQVLTVFQSDRLVEIPPDLLDFARELFESSRSTVFERRTAGLAATSARHPAEGRSP